MTINYKIKEKWIAIIPARAGSKSLSNKNIIRLDGKPLYMHSVEQAILAGADKIIISTNIKKILTTKHDSNVILHSRPENLSEDNTPIDDVIYNVCNEFKLSGTLVLLQPTSPLRRYFHIQDALGLYNKNSSNMIMSVTAVENKCLKYGLIVNNFFSALSNPRYLFYNRQNLPNVFRPNGAIYIFNAKLFMKSQSFSSFNIVPFIMDTKSSYDIDNIEDFTHCENILISDFKEKK